MKIAIHQSNQIFKDNYSYKWIEILKSKGIEVMLLDLSLDIQENLLKLKDCDGVMWHWYHFYPDKFIAPKVLNSIEFGLNIPVFPNINTAWHFDDKVSQLLLLKAMEAPVVDSWLFTDKGQATKFLETAQYPLVFKLAVGAGSVNVFKLNNKEEAKVKLDEIFDVGIYPYSEHEYKADVNKYRIEGGRRPIIQDILLKKDISKYIKKDIHWYYQIEKNYFYVQKFLDKNEFDIRVTVIGNRAFAFRRFNRDNDFRASGSGKIDYDVTKIPLEAVKIAFETSSKGKFQSMAYDFLTDTDGSIRIIEMSYAYVDKAVYDCPGHWDKDMNFIEGNLWPEDAHVEDFLAYIEQNA